MVKPQVNICEFCKLSIFAGARAPSRLYNAHFTCWVDNTEEGKLYEGYQVTQEKENILNSTVSLPIDNFHGHPKFLELTVDELKLHSEKNKDYARYGNPLGNFYQVSAALQAQGINLTPTQVALVFAQKQQDAAMQMIAHGYEGEVEDVDTRLRDVHIYYKIARILYWEEKNQVKEA